MEVYREILPESYLLILANDVPEANHDDNALDWALRRAARSGKSSVWVDCSHLDHLPPNAAELLTFYYHKLHKHGMNLLLCHVNPSVQKELDSLVPALRPPIVNTLLDAELYCQQERTTRRSA